MICGCIRSLSAWVMLQVDTGICEQPPLFITGIVRGEKRTVTSPAEPGVTVLRQYVGTPLTQLQRSEEYAALKPIVISTTDDAVSAGFEEFEVVKSSVHRLFVLSQWAR
jgi:hypothetical protein